MANNIDSIFAFGEDALTNLFEVALVTLPKGLQSATPLDLAMSGRITTVNIPGRANGMYERHYKTQVIEVPNGKVEQSKEFSFTLRIDKNFSFYELLSTWCDLANSAGQFMWVGSSEHYLGELIVKRCGNDLLPLEDGKNIGWHFHKVWIKSVADLSFDWSSGEPMDAEITCCFGWVETLEQSPAGQQPNQTPTPLQ